MDFQDDAAEFSSEDVDTIVKNAITGCLTDVMYNPKKVRRTRQRDKFRAHYDNSSSAYELRYRREKLRTQ